VDGVVCYTKRQLLLAIFYFHLDMPFTPRTLHRPADDI
jgi:hypothetical protein